MILFNILNKMSHSSNLPKIHFLNKSLKYLDTNKDFKKHTGYYWNREFCELVNLDYRKKYFKKDIKNIFLKLHIEKTKIWYKFIRENSLYGSANNILNKLIIEIPEDESLFQEIDYTNVSTISL